MTVIYDDNDMQVTQEAYDALAARANMTESDAAAVDEPVETVLLRDMHRKVNAIYEITTSFVTGVGIGAVLIGLVWIFK